MNRTEKELDGQSSYSIIFTHPVAIRAHSSKAALRATAKWSQPSEKKTVKIFMRFKNQLPQANTNISQKIIAVSTQVFKHPDLIFRGNQYRSQRAFMECSL